VKKKIIIRKRPLGCCKAVSGNNRLLLTGSVRNVINTTRLEANLRPNGNYMSKQALNTLRTKSLTDKMPAVGKL